MNFLFFDCWSPLSFENYLNISAFVLRKVNTFFLFFNISHILIVVIFFKSYMKITLVNLRLFISSIIYNFLVFEDDNQIIFMLLLSYRVSSYRDYL